MKIRTGLKLYLVGLFILCPNILWAKFVPEKTARQVAVNSMNKTIKIKALQHRQKGAVGQQAVQNVTEGQITYTYTATENDILVYYVFNFSTDGWTIISADDVAYPVIAYSESGFYDPNVSNQPPAFTAWMDNVASEISDAASRGLEGRPDAALAWKQFSVVPDNFVPDLGGLATAQSVDPLIQSHWGQGGETDGWPFGYEGYSKYCPWEYTNWTHLYRDYCPTGCVATAMAQIMKYWQWPPFGYGHNKYEILYTCSHECYGFGEREVDFSQRYYNWSASFMPLNSPSDAIASLMSDIGTAVNMQYTPDASGSTPTFASRAFHYYFRYQTVIGASKIQYSDPNWIKKLKAELDAGRPILYSGFNENYTDAHAFICDGYDLSDYFHFNWGWNGIYDGFFTLNALTPGAHNYTTSQDALFGIAPISEVYVDDDYIAYGYNDGHELGKDAFDNIQDAILAVYPGGTVYVAAGTYYEAIDFGGKAIHLLGTNGPGVTTIDGNGAYHVVKCVTGEGRDTILEGFTITGGDANGPTNLEKCGGGMYNYYSSPTVTNCRFISNAAHLHGGGMHNEHSYPTVTNCSFTANTAAAHSGGMMNNNYSYPTVVNCTFGQNTAGASGGGIANSWYSSSTVTNCTFTNNTATAGGGGIYLYASSLTATNCTFSGNTAYSGGGIFNEASSPIVTDCDFSKNTAQSFAGGGMYNQTVSNPIVTNCIFTGNTAANDGGGIYNVDSSSPTITNCTFSGNSVYYCGGGMYNKNSSSPFVTNCTFFGNSVSYDGGSYGGGMYNKNSSNPTVTNCIFWNDLNSEICNIDSSPIFTYSDIQGGTGQVWFGTGCFDADPCFVDAGSGNFRLGPRSPCIDAGENDSVPADTADLDGDGNTVEPTPFDFGGLPRFIDDLCTVDTGEPGTSGPPVVDMGAYEFLPADIDNSGSVDLRDFSEFALHWAETGCGRCGGANLTCDGDVDWNDLRVLTDWWLAGVNVEPPSQASNPNPADGATEVSTTADLSWTAGAFAESHDVYFGTSSSPPFIQNQTAATFDPGTMTIATTYYWRIDGVNAYGTTTGEVWRFTTFGPPP